MGHLDSRTSNPAPASTGLVLLALPFVLWVVAELGFLATVVDQATGASVLDGVEDRRRARRRLLRWCFLWAGCAVAALWMAWHVYE